MHWILIVRNLIIPLKQLSSILERSPNSAAPLYSKLEIDIAYQRLPVDHSLTFFFFLFSSFHRSLLNIFSFHPSYIPTTVKFVDDTSRKRGIFAVRLEATLKRSNNAVEEQASNADAGLPFSPPSASTDIITDIMAAGRPVASISPIFEEVSLSVSSRLPSGLLGNSIV